ncbi:LEPR-XLL domain-containing protein [Gimesia algae]|uniref:Uncharacterized protein n=1 Tax=Gimesia algae TaxID=2527971 RepID=A0A517VA13_9PLAN|nr:LEPR-XLL domain-containing protein [Gimesia algae]QDT89829.1 hypothetical protein Pan161_14620 [Gimesia algae]
MTHKNFMKNLRKRSRRHANKRNRRNAGRQQVQIEQLEPRLLLTADLSANRLEMLLDQHSPEDFTEGLNAFIGGLENLEIGVQSGPTLGELLARKMDPS